MGVYTAGELMPLYYVDESEYGTTPTGALSWAGDIEFLTPMNNFDLKPHVVSGSRAFSTSTRGPYQAGFQAQALARVADDPYDWADFWAYYGLGATDGVADDLDSFTAQIAKKVSTNYFYNFYNGCKINSLRIFSDNPGKEIHFLADVFAQFVTPDTDKTIAGLQALTVGADPSDITTAILTWAGILQINLGGGGANNFYPKRWNFLCNNNLDRRPGHRVGADSNTYPLTALKLDEGEREIFFDCTLPHENETYTNAKIAGTAITALTIPVGAKTITLSNGEFLADDLPELRQAPMEETFRATFKSLSIA